MILPQNEAYRSSNKAVAQRGRPISSVRPVCELPTQCFVMRILANGQAHFKWTYYIMSLANQCFVGTYTSGIQPTAYTTTITITITTTTVTRTRTRTRLSKGKKKKKNEEEKVKEEEQEEEEEEEEEEKETTTTILYYPKTLPSTTTANTRSTFYRQNVSRNSAEL
ncbi:hypothetical protein M0804_001208 [Polistes exclamans]|nr:hypothetical protein M0804_001208 [Polistes exclamans]